LVLLALAGCEKKRPKAETTKEKSDAGASKVEAIDPTWPRPSRPPPSNAPGQVSHPGKSKVARRPTACSHPARPTKSCERRLA